MGSDKQNFTKRGGALKTFGNPCNRETKDALQVFSISAWTTVTFLGDSVHNIKDPDNENMTITEEIPRLLVKSWYPFDAMSGMSYYMSLGFQVKQITL